MFIRIDHLRLTIVLVLLTAGCQPPLAPSAGKTWIETQLFFGLTRPGGGRISDAEWHGFVDHTVTPRFPDGLTIFYGDGQYRGDDGVVHKEPSAILILLHPAGDDAKLDEIAREYDRQFSQDSVLRVDQSAVAEFVTGATRPSETVSVDGEK